MQWLLFLPTLLNCRIQHLSYINQCGTADKNANTVKKITVNLHPEEKFILVLFNWVTCINLTVFDILPWLIKSMNSC